MAEGDTGTTGQPTGTQTSATTSTPGAAPEGYVEKARLDGALQKIQELTLANRALTDRLTAAEQRAGTLTADVAQKESAWNAQQSEFTTKLGSADKTIAELNAKLAQSDALKLKMKLITDAKAPQLFEVIDVIPDTTDEAVMKASIQKLAGFASQIAQSREKELMAGVTVTPQSPSATSTAMPTTNEGWQQHVNSLPFGSPEYHKAMDAWHSWLFTKQS